MTEAVQEQMFLPFFSTKIGRGGTGLGMSIVDNLVKKNIGRNLHVQSAPGEGSVFRLELPLVMTRTEDVVQCPLSAVRSLAQNRRWAVTWATDSVAHLRRRRQNAYRLEL